MSSTIHVKLSLIYHTKIKRFWQISLTHTNQRRNFLCRVKIKVGEFLKDFPIENKRNERTKAESFKKFGVKVKKWRGSGNISLMRYSRPYLVATKMANFPTDVGFDFSHWGAPQVAQCKSGQPAVQYRGSVHRGGTLPRLSLFTLDERSR